MEDLGIKPVVIREICELAQKYSINKVILFGSRARGDYKRVSDIDLAVSGGDIDRFALDVDEETSTLLNFCAALVNLKDIYQTDKRKQAMSGTVHFQEI